MFRDVMGAVTLTLIIAAISAAIYRGDKTAAIVGKLGESFSGIIEAATLQSKGQ